MTEKDEWVPLGTLRPGTLFETRDGRRGLLSTMLGGHPGTKPPRLAFSLETGAPWAVSPDEVVRERVVEGAAPTSVTRTHAMIDSRRGKLSLYRETTNPGGSTLLVPPENLVSSCDLVQDGHGADLQVKATWKVIFAVLKALGVTIEEQT